MSHAVDCNLGHAALKVVECLTNGRLRLAPHVSAPTLPVETTFIRGRKLHRLSVERNVGMVAEIYDRDGNGRMKRRPEQDLKSARLRRPTGRIQDRRTQLRPQDGEVIREVPVHLGRLAETS